MADYQEIPEAIRSFLAAKGHPWSEDLTEIATAYTGLCREANDRLRRCGEYLRRGLRSEAVHLGECQPKLLPLVAALKLPDPAAWVSACVANGLPAPPELLLDSIDQLESASEIELRLGPLLARHRLLSLAKSPVRDRIEVLGPLHEQDPGNPIWVENLRTLGTIRVKEIRTEAQGAYRTKDVRVLDRLNDELTANNWQVDVPDDLRKGVERALGSLKLEQAKDVLRPLLNELRTAHAELDLERATEVMQRWQEIIDTEKMALPTALQAAIRPLIAWVASETRRRNQEQKMQRMRPALQETERLFRSSNRRHTLLVWLIVVLALGAAGVLAYFYLPMLSSRG
jgi:hypothetical protein